MSAQTVNSHYDVEQTIEEHTQAAQQAFPDRGEMTDNEYQAQRNKQVRVAEKIFRNLLTQSGHTNRETFIREGLGSLVTDEAFSAKMRNVAALLITAKGPENLEAVDDALRSVENDLYNAIEKNSDHLYIQHAQLYLSTIQELMFSLKSWQFNRTDFLQNPIPNHYIPKIVLEASDIMDRAEAAGLDAEQAYTKCFEQQNIKLDWNEGTTTYNYLDRRLIAKESQKIAEHEQALNKNEEKPGTIPPQKEPPSEDLDIGDGITEDFPKEIIHRAMEILENHSTYTEMVDNFKGDDALKKTYTILGVHIGSQIGTKDLNTLRKLAIKMVQSINEYNLVKGRVTEEQIKEKFGEKEIA